MRLHPLLFLIAAILPAQVYSPRIAKVGQPDATDLKSLTNSVYLQADAQTSRQKAEAIWRFFLTDGRFVKPGIIYHIAGWAYEEPGGEVLDPVKLLNSYGFGLCYHIAPLLESVFKAGGFRDARVWFLTGHTVAEVFYDNSYHYFDSDMMGYNPIGTSGPLRDRPVASVHQLELDAGIITGKLAGGKDPANVDAPWYPADVRAQAMNDLAALFTSTGDNRLYPFQRFEAGHKLDFVLRPGERLIRYYQPEQESLYYLPYRFDGKTWTEFPREIVEYKIKTADGPRSQKDARTWATGRQEYRPAKQQGLQWIYSMPCPYVIIDANFQMNVTLQGPSDELSVEISVDGGRHWSGAGALRGPYSGPWTTEPAAVRSEHGSRMEISGTYGYLVRVTSETGTLSNVLLTTRFQLNPRTLPELLPGLNAMEYSVSDTERWELPLSASLAAKETNTTEASSGGNSYLANRTSDPGDIVFTLEAPDGGPITSFNTGGRFLDLRDGLAPDKFTAEVRTITPWPAAGLPQSASLAWSNTLTGPYTTLWSYDSHLRWKDGQTIDRTLRWPEVDREVRVPPNTRRVFVRYRVEGMGLDMLRFAVNRSGLRALSPLHITHVWSEGNQEQQQRQNISPGKLQGAYNVQIPAGKPIVNRALILESPARP